MFFHDDKLQFEVRVEKPNPLFAKMLQQAIGGDKVHPIPNSFPQEMENEEYSYAFMSTWRDESHKAPEGRWMKGKSNDGRGQYSTTRQPSYSVPDIGPALPKAGAQQEQVKATA